MSQVIMTEDYSNSCRFCLNFTEVPLRVQISDLIKLQFKAALNIDLKMGNNIYPEFYCLQCSQELQVCLTIREKIATNQKILEEHCSLQEDDKTDVLEFLHIKTEDVGEYNFESELAFEIRNNEDEGNLETKFNCSDNLNSFENISDCKKKVEKNIPNKKKESDKKGQEKTKKKDVPQIHRVNCKDCGKSFRTDSYKKHYERIHLKLRRHQCFHCGKSFFSKLQIEQHMKIHIGEKTEVCSQCGLKFYSSGSLKMHISLKHENIYERSCHYCGKIYKNITTLDGHIRSKHTLERKYPCPFEGCEKAFFTCADMIKHKKSYHKENEICPICSAEVKGLKKHMKRHEMKFVCEQVEKGVTCNKKFADSYLLKNHINTQHRGLRSFSCTLCDSVFARKPVLQNHIRTVHEQRRIKCELCSTIITRKDYYRKHVMENHRELDGAIKEVLLKKIKNTKEDDLFCYQK